ncbi:MAG: glycosyltransferase [Muribaculaceae bacterium]|nr:glycosyltransferase [Muribaculaceae bacterium]
MVKLQVLIATFGAEGLLRVAEMKLPRLAEVEYLVSCQIPGQPTPPIPSSLNRNDLHIYFSDSRGLSRNRNILLEQATAPFCLIADDDLSYEPECLLEVIRILDQNPEISVATFMYCDESGNYEKSYPDYSFDLQSPVKGYFPTSFEIAFRNKDVKDAEVLFNENFGIGAPHYGCGEEDLWLHELMKKGLQGRFFPVMLATHKGETTGIRSAAKPEVLRAQGVVIALTYPLASFPRIILKAWRTSKTAEKSFRRCLKYLLQGWADSFLKRKQLFGKAHNS